MRRCVFPVLICIAFVQYGCSLSSKGVITDAEMSVLKGGWGEEYCTTIDWTAYAESSSGGQCDVPPCNGFRKGSCWQTARGCEKGSGYCDSYTRGCVYMYRLDQCVENEFGECIILPKNWARD